MILQRKIESLVFRELQGGPLMHMMAAKTVAFKEELAPEFKTISNKVVKNTKVLPQELQKHGLDIITSDTDSHIVLVDLRSTKLTEKDVVDSLEMLALPAIKTLSLDTEKPTTTSRLCFGTAAEATSELEQIFKEIASPSKLSDSGINQRK